MFLSLNFRQALLTYKLKVIKTNSSKNMLVINHNHPLVRNRALSLDLLQRHVNNVEELKNVTTDLKQSVAS